MQKVKYFTIKKGGSFGTTLFYFKNLDGAMNMFKYLVEGNAVDITHVGIPSLKDIEEYKNGKKDYIGDSYFYYEGNAPDISLEIETLDIYTKDEILHLKEEREKLANEAKQPKKK